MTRLWHVAVVIPAKDEANSIERCLRSVQIAAWAVRRVATTDIVVIADGCCDHTAQIAAGAVGDRGTVCSTDGIGVGHARRLGVEIALQRSRRCPTWTWIANTDADTSVPMSWISHQLSWAQSGAVGTAGIVQLRRGPHLTPGIRQQFSRSYPLGGDGRHNHVHGANLGVRADTYLAAGGWTATMHTGEDHDLWKRVVKLGPTATPTSLKVRTSARRIGRAPHGFATGLALLAS